MPSIFITLIISLFPLSISPEPAPPIVSNCPAKYLRFSVTPTICLQPNPKYSIMFNKIPDGETRKQILKLHNSLRSLVAMGKEMRGGKLPTAANMMQMMWDDELAEFAQKWADNCVYKHDCTECRTVENFITGQNIAYLEYSPNLKRLYSVPNWEKVIMMFYDEVKDFDKVLISNFQNMNGKLIKHFTQMVWANSWKIGCGYTLYKNGPTAIRQFYVCNYGPIGNVIAKEMYKLGKPCSLCPNNSCCGDTCEKDKIYDGLCRMMDATKAPIHSIDVSPFIFYCDFNIHPCKVRIKGAQKWKKMHNLESSFISAILGPGEKSSLVIDHRIVPKAPQFCVIMMLRKSAATAGQKDTSTLTTDFEAEGLIPNQLPLKLTGSQYIQYSLNLGWNAPSTMTLTFSVPAGSYPHITDISEIKALNGPCPPQVMRLKSGPAKG